VRYIVEVHLRDGRKIEQPITEENATAHVQSRAFVWREGMTEDQKRESAIFTIFLAALDKGGGFISVTDADGRTWAVRSSDVITFNLRDVKGGKGVPQTIGFGPPVVEVEKKSVPTAMPVIVGARRRGPR
jgi:hypothetical protein